MGIPLSDTSRLHDLERLRTQINRMQRSRAEASLLPLDPAFSGLLPDEGLRVGAAYTIDPSPSLLAALLAPPSQKGMWCAVIGMPTIGLEALADFGVDLSRLILIPEPGKRWLTIASALSEVLPLVAVHPQDRLREAEAVRLNARLRDRACTLLVTAPWPQNEAVLRLEGAQWQGLHDGSGLLSQRVVTVTATGRRQAMPQRVQVLLPGPSGTVAPAHPTVTQGAHTPTPLRRKAPLPRTDRRAAG